MNEAAVKIVLLHPVLQVSDPKRPDLVGAGELGLRRSLLLRRRSHLALNGPNRWRLAGLRRHHHVGLLGMLRILLAHCLGCHACSWLHHSDDDEYQGFRERKKMDKRGTGRERERNPNPNPKKERSPKRERDRKGGDCVII